MAVGDWEIKVWNLGVSVEINVDVLKKWQFPFLSLRVCIPWVPDLLFRSKTCRFWKAPSFGKMRTRALYTVKHVQYLATRWRVVVVSVWWVLTTTFGSHFWNPYLDIYSRVSQFWGFQFFLISNFLQRFNTFFKTNLIVLCFRIKFF